MIDILCSCIFYLFPLLRMTSTQPLFHISKSPTSMSFVVQFLYISLWKAIYEGYYIHLATTYTSCVVLAQNLGHIYFIKHMILQSSLIYQTIFHKRRSNLRQQTLIVCFCTLISQHICSCSKSISCTNDCFKIVSKQKCI